MFKRLTTTIGTQHEEVDPAHLSLSDLSQYWQNIIRPLHDAQYRFFPLDSPTVAFAQDSAPQVRPIDWEKLVASNLEEPVVLSLRAEEVKTEQLDVRVYRRWDIDSFIAEMSSLGQHCLGFKMFYSPPFLSRITQNSRLKFRGYQLHKLKQLAMGEGLLSSGAGYTCHVHFPHMPVSDQAETHLSHAAQRVWFEEIVLPALRDSCPVDIWNHHPCSFDDIQGKANVKSEAFVQGAKQAIRIGYNVPQQYLDSFWQRIVELANAYRPPMGQFAGQFRNPLLAVSGHGLKLFTKADSVEEAAQQYLTHLGEIFSFDLEDPEWQCWVDLAAEDTPQCDTEAITLIWKPWCLDQWASGFVSSKAKAQHVKITSYRWQSTRDGGSSSVELLPSNSYHRDGLMAYHKAYNLNKEMFATPLKGHVPLSHQQFDGLAFSKELIEKWYAFNHCHPHTAAKSIRADLIAAYKKSTSRISDVLRDASSYPFGVRQEYRVHIQLLRHLATCGAEHARPQSDRSPSLPASPRDTSPDIDSPSPTEDMPARSTSHASSHCHSPKLTAVNFAQSKRGAAQRRIPSSENLSRSNSTPIALHKPYWVLPTRTVNQFIAAQTNRWLLLIDTIIATTNSTMNGTLSVPDETQLLNGITVSSVLQILRYNFHGDRANMNPLLLSKWRRRKNGGPTRQDEGPTDETESEFSSQDEDKGGDVGSSHGLGLDRIIQLHGTAWLPRELFHWHTPTPCMSQEAIQEQSLARSRFQQTFRHSHTIQQRIEDEGVVFQCLRKLLTEQTEGSSMKRRLALEVAAQMVVRAYVQEVIRILANRWDHSTAGVGTTRRLREFVKHCNLTANEAAGLDGLTYGFVEKMVGSDLRLVEVRADRSNSKARNGVSQLAKYNTGLWADKVFGLFDFDDPAIGDTKRRGWEKASFRQLYQRLYHFLSQQVSRGAALAFTQKVKTCSSQKLLIILHYDLDKLSVLYKASKHHASGTKEKIADLTELERTNWVIPQIAKEYRADAYWAWEGRFRRQRDGTVPTATNKGERLRRVQQALGELLVYGYFDKVEIFPIHTTDTQVSLSKDQARSFVPLQVLQDFEERLSTRGLEDWSSSDIESEEIETESDG